MHAPNPAFGISALRLTEVTTDRRSRILISCLALCILGGATFLTIVLISPPAPLPADIPATEFSAGRAMQDLEIIAREPRPMGVSPAHAAVRDHLLGEIRELGLEAQVQDTFGIRVVRPGFLLGGAVENILVRLPGANPDGAILMIAHYDSTPGAPGAADNGAGVATYLEILRALRADRSLVQPAILPWLGDPAGTRDHDVSRRVLPGCPERFYGDLQVT